MIQRWLLNLYLVLIYIYIYIYLKVFFFFFVFGQEHAEFLRKGLFRVTPGLPSALRRCIVTRAV